MSQPNEAFDGGHPDRDDLATLAVGAQPETEAARLRAHVDSCEQCSEILVEYTEIAASTLAASLPEIEPRAGVGSAIMRTIEAGEGPARRYVPTESARPSSLNRWWRPLSALAAAAALAATAVLGFTTLDARDDADDARDQVRRLEETLADGTLISLMGTDLAPEARVTLVVAEDGETALLTARALPENDSGAYHLWLFNEGQPQRASAFDIREGETSRLLLEGDVLASDAMAITLEEKEETDVPEGPVLLEGEVTAS
jgi:Anti-sigma-K factor rskA, C-terminal